MGAPYGNLNLTYDKFVDLFADSSFLTFNVEAVPYAEVTYSNIADIDLSNIDNWKSGDYSYNDGTFTGSTSRIALNSYVVMDAGKYIVNFSNENYHLLVRQINKAGKLISSSNISNNGTFVISDDCAYVGIAVYNANSSSVTFNDYEKLFSENGYLVKLN